MKLGCHFESCGPFHRQEYLYSLIHPFSAVAGSSLTSKKYNIVAIIRQVANAIVIMINKFLDLSAFKFLLASFAIIALLLLPNKMPFIANTPFTRKSCRPRCGAFGRQAGQFHSAPLWCSALRRSIF